MFTASGVDETWLARPVIRSLLDVRPPLLVDHHLKGLRAPFRIDGPQKPIQDQEALLLQSLIGSFVLLLFWEC